LPNSNHCAIIVPDAPPVIQVATKLARAFGNLKVRYKLMLLHNLFYLVLSCGVYFSLVPAIEEWAGEARAREAALRQQLSVATGHPLPEPEADFYEWVVYRAKVTILVVLGVTYWLAVLILEGFVMPFYIYRPLRVLLQADEASRRGDRDHELVEEAWITDDELGRLMRSRNATLEKLRRHEEELERTLARLEEALADLRRKNYMLETAKQSIAEQDRLASLGLLAASLAHEINTPLAVLRGSIEQMLEGARGEAVRRRLERMLRVTGRLQRMSETMLGFVRLRGEDVERVGVAEVVREAWELVAIDERAGRVSFEMDVPADLTISGNPDRISQLFVNVLRNALNAAPPGGHVWVRARRIQAGEKPMVAVRIEDDGPGIPADVLPSIFEAFVTTRLDSKGTGLGLTVAEGIAHQHGGIIVASNRPQGGACLEVRLPAARGAEGEPGIGDGASGSAEGERKQVRRQ